QRRSDPHPRDAARARSGQQDRQLHGVARPRFAGFSGQHGGAAQLAEIFAQQRHDNMDLSGVAVIDPQLTLLPQIEANGMMHMAGFFLSVPTKVILELLDAPGAGRWRVFGFSVSFGQAAPAAPQPPAPAAPPAAAPAPKANPPNRPAAPKQ